MNTQTAVSPARQTTVSGLAVVGFVALVVAGIWLAIYSTRFVPAVVNRIGLAAVYIGSVFTPAPGSSLSVVPTPTASTTIPFGTDATSSATTVTTPVAVTTKPKPVATGTGAKTTIITVGSTTPVTLSGLGDLAVNIDGTGYLTTNNTASFVASSSVPHGDNAAVRFTIKNVGTNYSGTWSFSATIPTYPAFVYNSQPQISLAPGDSIDYTIGFNQANVGKNEIVTVTIAPATADSNKLNNSATASLNVQ